MEALSLGLLADTTMELSKLRTVVDAAKLNVRAALVAHYDDFETLPSDVDVWVVRIDIGDDRAQDLVDYLDALDVPVIYDEAEFYSSLKIEEGARRLSKKIAACGFKAAPAPVVTGLAPAKYVWVLAASAGGPEAVLNFLKEVPPDIRNVAFIYVQHMDEAMVEPLHKSIARNTEWQAIYCNQPWKLYEKSVYMISPVFEVQMSETGALNPSQTPWDGPYRPSVDHVVAKVWRKFGKDSGVIVFSGMGNDGAKTCRMIKNAGGQVWVQSPESCAVDSMPNEVVKTECVSFIGTPSQLARHFSVYHRKLNQMFDAPTNKERSL